MPHPWPWVLLLASCVATQGAGAWSTRTSEWPPYTAASGAGGITPATRIPGSCTGASARGTSTGTGSPRTPSFPASHLLGLKPSRVRKPLGPRAAATSEPAPSTSQGASCSSASARHGFRAAQRAALGVRRRVKKERLPGGAHSETTESPKRRPKDRGV
jgi:hypothetical protein